MPSGAARIRRTARECSAKNVNALQQFCAARPEQTADGEPTREWAHAFCKRWKLNGNRVVTEKAVNRTVEETATGG